MKVEGGRMTEIGEMIPQRYCSGRDAGGHDAEERKAPLHKSLNSEEIIRTGTRITQIGRIYTDPGVSVSTVAPVDVAQPSRPLTPCTRMPAHWHTWTRPQGAQPLTYGSCHTWRPVFYRPPPIIHDDKKPQIMAPRVTPLEGVSSYALRGIGVRGVKNPQGFGIDERRFVHQVEIMDANALQLSEREIANKVKGAGRKLPHMAMKTSRGCPYKCIYVSKQIFEHKFRGQRQERTVEYSRDFEEFFSSKPL